MDGWLYRLGLATLFAATCGLAPAFAQTATSTAPAKAPSSQKPAEVAAKAQIAVVVDGPSELYDRSTAQLAREINTLLKGRPGNWRAPSQPNFVGDYSAQGAKLQLLKALADPEIKMVIVMGMEAGRAAASIPEFSKPVMLPFAVPALQKLPKQKNGSGKHNLAYLSGVVDIRRELEAFVDFTGVRNVVFLVDNHYLQGAPSIQKDLQQIVGTKARVRVVGAGRNVPQTLSQIPADTQALYIGPLLRLPSRDYPALVKALNQRKIATYASEGRPWLEMGALMSIVPDDDMQRRLRRIALYVDSAVDGEDPAGFSTDYASRTALLLNAETAKAIGIHPTFAQLSESEIVGETGPSRASGPSLQLKEVVLQALQSNRELGVTRVDAGIAESTTKEAVAALYPTAQLQISYSQIIPESNAIMSFARTASWGGNVNIPVYSVMAWANRRSKESAQIATDHGIDAKELDIVAQTATAFINVLRAKNAETINRQNLIRIRRNLDMAKVRVELGAVGRQDLFRWQIEVADGKANVIRSKAVRNQSNIQLNRLINRPLENPVYIDSADDEHLGLVVDPRIQPFVRDPFSFGIFREFMVQESIANSPEIRQLDESIRSMSIMKKGQERELWIPNVFATINLTHNFYMEGTPKAFQSPPPQPGQPAASGGVEFPKTPNLTVGLSAAWTAFDYRRNARIDQSDRRILQMRRQRGTIAQSIEQRVRSAMHQAGASGAVVQLRNEAAQAARENFELVSDAYQKGSVGLITLVDAQNQALQTELAAANALYDWLIDFIEVQRATGSFNFLESERNHNDFVTRLQKYYSAQKGQASNSQ